MNRIGIAVLLFGILLLAACGQSTQPAPLGEVPDETPIPVDIGGGIGNTEKEFVIVASKFMFDPNTITVKEGDTVKIVGYTKDVPHSIAIPEFGVNLDLPDGSLQTTSFVADKKGTFKYFCSVPCGSGHRSMVGTLIVE